MTKEIQGYTAVQPSGDDSNPACPRCGNYNAMLGNGRYLPGVPRLEILDCRDCGQSAVLDPAEQGTYAAIDDTIHIGDVFGTKPDNQYVVDVFNPSTCMVTFHRRGRTDLTWSKPLYILQTQDGAYFIERSAVAQRVSAPNPNAGKVVKPTPEEREGRRKVLVDRYNGYFEAATVGLGTGEADQLNYFIRLAAISPEFNQALDGAIRAQALLHQLAEDGE